MACVYVCVWQEGRKGSYLCFQCCIKPSCGLVSQLGLQSHEQSLIPVLSRVVSLILCHKTPRARVKQIEKLVEIAQRLRALNNYSALRAFVAGINNATFPGDETMEQFKAKSPDQAKNLQSWDVLLQHIRAHRAYRLALRNSKGACIPALYVMCVFFIFLSLKSIAPAKYICPILSRPTKATVT